MGLVLGGLVFLVSGSRRFLDGAVAFTKLLRFSEIIIGLTPVAVDTSLPELVTFMVAAIRGQRDIAVGNVVGSYMFNIVGVPGVAGILAPAGIGVQGSLLMFDIPVMMAVAFACLPVFFTGGGIGRMEGAALFGYYVAYTLYLILTATHHGIHSGSIRPISAPFRTIRIIRPRIVHENNNAALMRGGVALFTLWLGLAGQRHTNGCGLRTGAENRHVRAAGKTVRIEGDVMCSG